MKAIKIYGERNSGTNYLERLVTKNLETELLRYVPTPFVGRLLIYEILSGFFFELNSRKFLGWKHGMPRIKCINHYNKKDLLVVTLTKNPYAFLLSLYKRPYHYRGDRNVSFKEFLQNRWETIWRDHSHQQYYASPVALWNEKNRAYLELSGKVDKPVINLRYEDLLKGPEQIIATLAEALGADYRDPMKFHNEETSTKGDDRTFSAYKKYYEEERWKVKLDEEEIGMINERLDLSVLRKFNYELLHSKP